MVNDNNIESRALRGDVKWFSAEKGYGFIRVDGEHKDVFVHFSQINGSGYKSLEVGQRVQLDTEKAEKGLAAVNVDVLAA